MGVLHKLRAGALQHPFFTVLGVYNFTSGIAELAAWALGDAEARPWTAIADYFPPGLLGFVVGLFVLKSVYQAGERLLDATVEFRDAFVKADDEQKTRLLVGLRAYGTVWKVGNRRAAFMAGMTVKSLDERTIGAGLAMTPAQREAVQGRIGETVAMHKLMDASERVRMIRLRVAAVAVPIVCAVLAYAAGWDPRAAFAVPAVGSAMLLWMTRPFKPTQDTRLRAVYHVLYDREDVPEVVKSAVGRLSL